YGFSAVSQFCSYGVLINVGLAVFNLLPGLPLDGGRILRAILWQITGNYRRSTGIAVAAGRGIAYLLIGGGILWAFLGGGLSGLWLAFIGWFMENAATQSYRSMLFQEALRGVTVQDLMTPECIRIPGGLSVAQLVDEYIFPQGRRCFMVVDGDTLEGMVTVHNVRDLPRERWPVTPVAAIMTPLARLIVARPQEDAFEVLRRMDEWNVNQMPVIDEGRFLGMVARDSLIRYLRTWADLGF
ncbi:MAG: CBS domain-containing protein, partial [Chloroflexia bacterium]